jgi:hypothetical protein
MKKLFQNEWFNLACVAGAFFAGVGFGWPGMALVFLYLIGFGLNLVRE